MSEGVLEKLVDELRRLPGIGAKTAERLAYHLLKVSNDEALALSAAIRSLKESVRECSRCYNITEQELCSICSDSTRDSSVICVIEQPKDLQAIEASGKYRGLYHILGGNFSPMDKRDLDSLTLAALERRVRDNEVQEVILATNPDFDGDGTAMLVAERLNQCGARVSRLARGVPSGSQIEYMNSSILADALEGRRSYGETTMTPPSPRGTTASGRNDQPSNGNGGQA